MMLIPIIVQFINIFDVFNLLNIKLNKYMISSFITVRALDMWIFTGHNDQTRPFLAKDDLLNRKMLYCILNMIEHILLPSNAN